MRRTRFVWDDFPGGNADHVAEHGITRDEVEEVVRNRRSQRAVSRSSDRPIIFGRTKAGRSLAVVVEDFGGRPRVIYPITAFETDP